MKNLLGLLTEATLAGMSGVEGRTASALIQLGMAMRGVVVALAFSAALVAQMNPQEIVRRSIATWDLGSKTGRSYSFTERDEGRHLDASGGLKSAEVDVS